MTNIIVVFPKLEDAKKIKNLLVRNGFNANAVCTTGAQAIAYADGFGTGIIVSSYKLADMLYSEIKECMPKGFELLLLASQNHLNECYDQEVMMLSMPLKVHELLNTIDMMVQNARRRRRKQKLEPKERKEEEKILIQNAKALLMERNHMTEEEAHRYIQKCSMDSGTNMVETAQMVLSIMKG